MNMKMNEYIWDFEVVHRNDVKVLSPWWIAEPYYVLARVPELILEVVLNINENDEDACRKQIHDFCSANDIESYTITYVEESPCCGTVK